nr:hypothetical protein [Tanacetum cinerariifolium]
MLPVSSLPPFMVGTAVDWCARMSSLINIVIVVVVVNDASLHITVKNKGSEVIRILARQIFRFAVMAGLLQKNHDGIQVSYLRNISDNQLKRLEEKHLCQKATATCLAEPKRQVLRAAFLNKRQLCKSKSRLLQGRQTELLDYDSNI